MRPEPWNPGGESRALTPAEKTFLDELLTDEPPFLDVWLHRDDGGPWLIVSLDFIEGDAVGDTLRLDFDGRAIRGGWSPSFLNGDDGVQANAGRDRHGRGRWNRAGRSVR